MKDIKVFKFTDEGKVTLTPEFMVYSHETHGITLNYIPVWWGKVMEMCEVNNVTILELGQALKENYL